MSATAVQPEAMPDRQESQEVKPLIPTPERLSELLEMDINEVRRMYQSATERGQLVDQIMAEQETLSEHHSNIYRDEMEELIRVGGRDMVAEKAPHHYNAPSSRRSSMGHLPPLGLPGRSDCCPESNGGGRRSSRHSRGTNRWRSR